MPTLALFFFHRKNVHIRAYLRLQMFVCPAALLPSHGVEKRTDEQN